MITEQGAVVIKSATILGSIKIIVEQYIYCDWDFLKFLFVLIVIDSVLGYTKHWKLNTISSKGFGKLITKFLAYGSVLVLGHVMKYMTIGGKECLIFSWLPTVAYTALILREAISILENIGVICPNLIPAWVLRKLKEYDEKGKFKN